MLPKRLQQIESAIAQAAGVTIEEIRGRSRSQPIVDARHAIWYVAHKHFGYTSAYIGRLYKRDHTTVLHGVYRIRDEAADHLTDGIKSVIPEAFENLSPESKGRRISDWNWGEVTC